MTSRIREATSDDWSAIWPIVREVVRAADTFTYDPRMTEDTARAMWMVGPPGRTIVAVDGPAVLGTANMYANRDGPGAHVASASFMVASAARGHGVGRALVEDALSWARAARFRGMQFNAVAETNAEAVALYRSAGFSIVGTVPEAFNHPRHGLVGLHVMYRPREQLEALPTPQGRSMWRFTRGHAETVLAGARDFASADADERTIARRFGGKIADARRLTGSDAARAAVVAAIARTIADAGRLPENVCYVGQTRLPNAGGRRIVDRLSAGEEAAVHTELEHGERDPRKRGFVEKALPLSRPKR